MIHGVRTGGIPRQLGNLPARSERVEPIHAASSRRIVVADASATYRDGLCFALEQHGELQVTARAATGAEAISRALDAHVDGLVIDMNLPDCSSVHVCRTVVAQRPTLPVVLLSYWDWDVYLAEAYAAGAAGFVLKRTDPRDLADGVCAALHQRSFTVSQLHRIQLWESTVEVSLRRLSAREWDVLWAVTSGGTNRGIAQDLSLSESTVEKYVSVVLRKLNLTSRAGLLVYVMQNQLSLTTCARQVGQRAAPALR